MISNCGKDENGSYTGGQAGDQTGKEYWLISWYDSGWKCILRHPNPSVRGEIARLATNAANNNRVGYDQGQRITFWNELVKVQYDPARITTPCEADCSSSTAAIVKATGYQLHDSRLMSVSPYLTTFGMRAALQSVGFHVLTDSKYLKSDAYLLAGDILLNDSAHAAINVTNGAYADTSYGGTPQPTTPQNPSTGSEDDGGTGGGADTTQPTESVKKGDLVALKDGATYYSGASIPSWVKAQRWYVSSIIGSRAVLGKNESGNNNINSPVDVKYLTVVSGGSSEETPTQPAQPTQPTQPSTYTPLVCMMTQSTCYRGTSKMAIKGVLWHSTGANNPYLKRYVQPDDNASDRAKLLSLLGTNQYKNDWNHISVQAGLNAWVGKLASGEVASVQTMPWDYKPWGCGGGCNNGWIQFEICEDGLTDRSYFNAAYAEAVKLTAYLCKKFGINPYGKVGNVPTILCHQDSYRLGMGTNHSDVYHWFNRYGKTMDNVRDDVAAILGTAKQTTPTTYKYGDRELEKGCEGDDVKELQEKLLKLGYKLPKYGADGDFGNETDEAVREFQKDNKLFVDGVVGVNTYAAIAKKLG